MPVMVITPRQIEERFDQACRCREAGAFDEALKGFYQIYQAVQLWPSDYPPRVTWMVDALNATGAVAKIQHQYDIAYNCFHESYEMRRATLGPLHPDTAQSCEEFGDLFRCMDRVVDAEKWYLQSVAILEQCDPSWHFSCADTYYKLGKMFHALGNVEKAEGYFRRCLQLLTSSSLSWGDRDPQALSGKIEAVRDRLNGIQQQSVPVISSG